MAELEGRTLGVGMGSEVAPGDHARRNRIIAIVAGAITVTAIVLGFAGDVLGLPWHWMRPAAEPCIYLPKVCLIWITAGPSTIINRAGSMRRTSGIIILTEAL